MYFSYTQLKTGGTLTLNDSSANYTNGTGWIDRQWANGQVSTVYMSLIANTVKVFQTTQGGLGKYIWLNLHLGRELQYMIYVFPSPDSTMTKGTTFVSTINRYGNGTPEYGLKGKGKVLETVMNNGIEFPLKYSLETKDGTYILDGSKFSKSVSIDISNNIHWDGSAIVYDQSGKIAGTGFLEANQFTEKNTYAANELLAMGLDTTKENKAMFSSETKLPLAQGLPGILALLLAVIIVIVLIVLFIRTIFKKQKA